MKMLQQGFILPIILISMFMITTTSLYILDLSIANHTTATKEAARVNAQFAADSGLDIGIQDLNADETITNLPETTLYSDTKQRTTYQILIVDGAVSTKKSIIATGRTYIPASAATATVVRKYQLDVAAVTSGIGLTSVVSGVGGLILNNNARITGGDVAINGSLTINNNAQIGLSTTDYINHPEQIVNVRVADMICPIPATAAFPRVCAGGEAPEPITMGLNGFIYGDVRATNQVTGTNMLNPGLTLSQTVAPYVLPDYDRAGQKAAVTSTVNATDAGIKCANNASVTWPANVKIVGDVATGNNCSVTITGDVWITGSVSMGNKAQFVISNALGTTRPTIMIDGPLGVVFGTTNTIDCKDAGRAVQFRQAVIA